MASPGEPRFCPACGGGLASRAVDGAPRQVCGRCGRVHYLNPKAAVGGILRRGGEVLLCQRGRPPKEGWWDLPGGFLEVDESPEEGLARELREELGVELRRALLLGAWSGRYAEAASLNLLYLAEAEGEPRAMDDVAAVRWWPLDKLPERLAWPHEADALRVAASGVVQGRWLAPPWPPGPPPPAPERD